jgi:SAC3/GANP family
MSVTAAGADDNEIIRSVGIVVYEAAADAALLAGNLGFYLTCQSRLLKDLYPRLDTPSPRENEIAGLSILYFAVFSPDSLEVVCQLRGMSRQALKTPDVRFALNAARCHAQGNYFAFCSAYSAGTCRQQTIMHPALLHLRDRAMLIMARSYRCLSAPVAANWLALSGPEQARKILVQVRPDLEACNSDMAPSSLCFVVPKNARAVS